MYVLQTPYLVAVCRGFEFNLMFFCMFVAALPSPTQHRAFFKAY
jgi:hypothetical protein